MKHKRHKKLEMYKRQRGMCPLCEKFIPLPEATIDHKIPLSRGLDHRDNLQVTCRKCNQDKNNMTTIEYAERYQID